MRWNYSMARQPGNLLALDWYQSRGLKAMIATATNAEGGMLFQPEERDKGNASSGISPIKSFIKLAAERNIGGMLCTAWDDKSPHMENYWRGFIASAEYSWSPDGRSLEEYDKSWLQREFGLSMPDYLTFFNMLRDGSTLWYEAYYKNGGRLDEDNTLQSLMRVEHWLPALEGQEKVSFDYTSKLIELPDQANPGSWTKKYKTKLDRAMTEMKNHDIITERLSNLYSSSIRNRYYWSLCAALYDLQYTAPKILLALKDCDTSDGKKQLEGIQNLKRAVSDFYQAWSQLENVYGQTRFVEYPASYIPDRYFHLASQSEDLTWMIQPEKLFLGMIDKWMNTGSVQAR
jgi:hexosaminidase